jgi:DNA polymerase
MPFVGPAGNLLTKMLSAINLDRARDVFITNILKCRPPGNRTPAPAETVPCMHILKRQIEIIAPKVLLLLGRIAAQEVLGRTESIAVLRGEKLDYNGVPVIVTYHPAALLRNAQYKAPAWEDLKRLQKILKEM